MTTDLNRELKKEKRLKADAELVAARLQDSLIQPDTHLEQAKAKFDEEKVGLLVRVEEAKRKTWLRHF